MYDVSLQYFVLLFSKAPGQHAFPSRIFLIYVQWFQPGKHTLVPVTDRRYTHAPPHLHQRLAFLVYAVVH